MAEGDIRLERAEGFEKLTGPIWVVHKGRGIASHLISRHLIHASRQLAPYLSLALTGNDYFADPSFRVPDIGTASCGGKDWWKR